MRLFVLRAAAGTQIARFIKAHLLLTVKFCRQGFEKLSTKADLNDDIIRTIEGGQPVEPAESINSMGRTGNWKWMLWGAAAITLLALCPQLLLWGSRAANWNGSYAEVHGDEWVYSAYVQALIDGRPRRNDPYTGRDDRPDRPQPESLFSIQFVPAYLIAGPARLFGASSSTAFIVVGILLPFLACLAILWLLASVTQDQRLAAAGAVLVLCFGTLAAGEGLVHLLISGSHYSFLPFLRRYEPLVPFPLFFVFCTLLWKSLNDQRRAIAWAIAAGLVLDLLIFSYFFLWTTGVAWLACVGLLWFIAYPNRLRRDVKSFVIILFLILAALIPYFILLSHRSLNMDAGQMLILSRAPDLLRVPELLGLLVIASLAFGVLRGRLNWRAPEAIFAAAFSLTPLLVFNQQVITGSSLQPFHYEWFIANYVVLVGLVITTILLWRGPDSARRPIRYRVAGRLVFIAVWWAAIEVLAPAKVIIRESQFKDRAAAVCQRLRHLSNSEAIVTETDPRPLVLASDHKVAIILPTFAPQAVLWAPHFDFLNLSPGESKARFYKYLYYTGIDDHALAKELSKPLSTFAAAAFGHERVIPDLAVQTEPITGEEIGQQVAEYQSYCSSFTRERAVEHIISYVIVPAEDGPNLSNIDRWYQRDHGEQVGDFILYRVRLRP